MCEFILSDGTTHDELDYADKRLEGGWRNFPFKRKVVAVKMFKRLIAPDTFRIPGESLLGFAIHFVGVASQKMVNPYHVREVMIVQKNKKVLVCSMNLKNKKWFDYMDNLKNPERPHLISYDLSIHGM